jgi:hypothetical protein
LRVVSVFISISFVISSYEEGTRGDLFLKILPFSMILNCFYLRERFPQVGPQSRAAESSEAVPFGMLSTLDRVTGGKIIASKKRFKIG